MQLVHENDHRLAAIVAGLSEQIRLCWPVDIDDVDWAMAIVHSCQDRDQPVCLSHIPGATSCLLQGKLVNGKLLWIIKPKYYATIW